MLITPDKARLILDALPGGPMPQSLEWLASIDDLRAELRRAADAPPTTYQADDPAPDSAVARVRDAVNAAYDAAVAELAPGAGFALVCAVTVITDGVDTLDLDTRTTARADLEALRAADVDLGGLGGADVLLAILGALRDDVATAINPGGRLN